MNCTTPSYVAITIWKITFPTRKKDKVNKAVRTPKTVQVHKSQFIEKKKKSLIKPSYLWGSVFNKHLNHALF